MGTKFSHSVRELTSHRVNGLNEAIRIFVLDKPGQGNACHEYLVCVPTPGIAGGGADIIREAQEGDAQEGDAQEGDDAEFKQSIGFRFEGREDTDPSRIIYVPNEQTLMTEEWLAGWPGSLKRYYETQAVSFQNGPIKENGYNGNSQEAMIAILIDRLEGFQAGPYKCHDNQMALDHIQGARLWLHKRTMDRVGRGVEGTMAK